MTIFFPKVTRTPFVLLFVACSGPTSGGSTSVATDLSEGNTETPFEQQQGADDEYECPSAEQQAEEDTPISLAVKPYAVTLNSLCGPVQLKASAGYGDGAGETVTAEAEWSSSDPSVATVGKSSGLLTLAPSPDGGVVSGATTITATFYGFAATAKVTVDHAALSAIAVSPATANAGIRGTTTFKAKGSFSDGTACDVTNTVLWSSGTSSVATIDTAPSRHDGTATGVAYGTSVITAAFQGEQGTATITVTP